MSEKISAYLDAMGIDRWLLRDSEAGQVQEQLDETSGSVPEVEDKKPIEASDSPLLEEVANQVSEPEMLKAASLPDFPAQVDGRILIVCSEAQGNEGSGSAFHGEAAGLLNAMLSATKWPAEQCVLLDGIEQLALAVENIQPIIVVALGDIAAEAVLTKPVESARQSIHDYAGTKAIASYHPVQVHLNPGQYKRAVWEDLKLAMAEVQ